MTHEHQLEQGREDGLSHCLVCGGAEGSLPTCCPGRKLTTEEHDVIHAGYRDFDRGPMNPIPMWWAAYEAVDTQYSSLDRVLTRAFMQASRGKGAERHAAAGEPFDQQVMQDMAKRFGIGALLGQAFKKSEESQRLPHDRAVAELLGAINYLAGAVIALERIEANKGK